MSHLNWLQCLLSVPCDRPTVRNPSISYRSSVFSPNLSSIEENNKNTIFFIRWLMFIDMMATDGKLLNDTKQIKSHILACCFKL